MRLTKACSAWVKCMAKGTKEDRRILRNLTKDPCVPQKVAGTFLSELGTPPHPTTPTDAKEKAYCIVKRDPDRYTCTGREVPAHLFSVLFRLEEVHRLRYRFPSGALDRIGLTDKALDADDIPDEDLRLVTDDYEGSIALGNPLDLVWVADDKDARSYGENWQLLSDALGRPRSGRPRFIVCVYERGDAKETLHVPRVLDAITKPEFEPNEDCSADVGRTRPVGDSPGEGLPEAVHRACEVVPKRWELVELT